MTFVRKMFEAMFMMDFFEEDLDCPECGCPNYSEDEECVECGADLTDSTDSTDIHKS